MSMHRIAGLLAVTLLGTGFLPLATRAAGDIGQPATQAQIDAWNDTVSGAGDKLPPGSGTVGGGHDVYATKCASCHGAQGQGGPMDRLVGGTGTLNTAKPVKTVGSYWPYATTVFDYIRRAMPFTSPGTLTNDEVYAVTAYVLHMNGIVPANAVMNAKALAAVKMPNEPNFLRKDPRPDAP
ncbi:MAG: cytochrome c [Candidatus Velthaea sp.]